MTKIINDILFGATLHLENNNKIKVGDYVITPTEKIAMVIGVSNHAIALAIKNKIFTWYGEYLYPGISLLVSEKEANRIHKLID